MVLVRLLRAARLRRREVPADMAVNMVDRLLLPERQLLPLYVHEEVLHIQL